MTMPRSRISNAPEKNCSAVSFIHLELRRDPEEDYKKVEESKAKQGLDYKILNKILCSLQGGCTS